MLVAAEGPEPNREGLVVLGGEGAERARRLDEAVGPRVEAARLRGKVGELRRRDILVRYFGSEERTKDYLRVTIGTAPEMFRFLDAVEDILSRGT